MRSWSNFLYLLLYFIYCYTCCTNGIDKTSIFPTDLKWDIYHMLNHYVHLALLLCFVFCFISLFMCQWHPVLKFFHLTKINCTSIFKTLFMHLPKATFPLGQWSNRNKASWLCLITLFTFHLDSSWPDFS